MIQKRNIENAGCGCGSFRQAKFEVLRLGNQIEPQQGEQRIAQILWDLL